MCPQIQKGGEGRLVEKFAYSFRESEPQLPLEGKYRATLVRNQFHIHELCEADEKNILTVANVRVSPGDILVFSSPTRYVGHVNQRLAKE
jgi:hypothetical protein